MADNVTANAGSGGATLATDDIGGVHFPRTKLIHGADGVNAGDVSDANPLPVDDAGGSLTVDNAALSVTGGGVEASALRVTLASDSTGVLSVDDNGGSLTVDNAALSVTGGGVEASALRVTIANDSTGVLSVDDNGGSLTVDGTVAATQSGTWNVTNVSGTVSLPTGASTLAEQQTQTTSLQLLDDAIVADDAAFSPATTKVMMAGFEFDDSTPDSVNEGDAGAARMSANRCIYVNIRDNAGNERGLNVDSSGNITANITGTVTVGSHAVTNAGTFAVQVDGAALTALQLIDNIVLAEDAGHSSGDPGVAMFAVRNDSDTSLCGTTLDYTPLQVDANGYLKVNIKAGAGSGGTASTDDAAFTAASGSGTPMMGFVTSDSVDSGDVGVVGMLANRQLKVTLYDSAGVELAVGGGTQYTEDAAAAANPVGNSLIMVRADSLAGVTSADGDNVAARGTDKGELYVKHVDTIAATQSGTWNVTNISGTVSLPTGAATAANQATIIGHVDGLEGLLTTIDADTGALAGCVGGTELQVDIVAALPAGTNNIGDVDVLSVVPGTGATNLGKAVDSVAGATDTGVAVLAVRDDALATLTPVDGDYVPLRVDDSGRLWASVSNAGSFAVQATSLVPGTGATSLGKAEDAAHASGDVGVMALSVRQDTAAALAGTDADYQPLITDSSGRLHVNVGNTVTVGSHAVTNAGTFAVQVDGAALTALQLIDDAIVADDAAFTPATTKVMMAGFEFDDTTPDSVNEGDAGAARMSANRCIYVNLRDNAGNERGLNVDASGNISVATVTTVSAVTSITNAVTVVGNAAHDAAVSGNPVLNAAEARTSESAVSASGDVVRLMADLVGKLVTMPYAPTDLQWQGTGSKTDTTDLAVKAAAGAGIRNYITDLICANSSATNVTVIVKDGSTEIARLPVPANGGVVHRFSTPLKGTANTAINLASSASATTIYMTAAGFTGR